MVESDSLYKILMSKPDPLISGAEPTSDESHKWVKDNEDLNEMEQGIPITEFPKDVKTRNLEMEFRVSSLLPRINLTRRSRGFLLF